MPSFFTEKKGTDLILHNKYGTFSKEEIKTHLISGTLTIKDLSIAYGLKSYQLEHIIKCLGIVYRAPLNDTRISNPTVSHHMHQMLIGTLLGDASMSEPKYYRVTHGMGQLPYTYHIAECLDSYVSSIHYKKEVNAIEVYTNRHDNLIPYFERFYSHGKHKKYMFEDIIADIDPEGLAFWYMDDGKYSEYGAYLCVGNVTKEEGNNLRDTLENKFSLKTTLQNHDIKKGYYNIYIKSESRDHFYNLIDPYIIPSMRYKITGDKVPDRYTVKDIVSYHLDLCNKLKIPVRFSGDSFVEDRVNLGCPIKDSKELYIEGIKNKLKEGSLKTKINIRKMPLEDVLKEHFKSGMTDVEIGEKYGFGRNTIAGIRRSLGIEPKRKRVMVDSLKFPCMSVKLVDASKVQSNGYNPNKVAAPEMELLIHSIEEDGVTQPIVVYHDPEQDKFIVIDGFHRYTVLINHFKCSKVPVVVLDKSIKDRMASTIRHNRARGRHQVDLMGVIVKDLYEQGWSDEQIANHLGMEGEELLRLRQQIGCAKILANNEYSKSWEVYSEG